MNSHFGRPESNSLEQKSIGQVLADAIGDIPDNYESFATELSIYCGHNISDDNVIENTLIEDEPEIEEIGKIHLRQIITTTALQAI